MKQFCLLVVTAACNLASAGAAEHIVVHEWGTFTSLQDEAGQAIGGINTDDEPLPEFVHRIAPNLIFPQSEPVPQSKGVPRCHSDVTMRLETPVIYFYPRENFRATLHVQVRLGSGWLTEFFPEAEAEAWGLTKDYIGPILPHTYGSLEWKEVRLIGNEEPRTTLSRVWLAPRAVEAATLEANGEREKFLFYRGVANKEAPLKVRRDGPELIITGRREANIDVPELWLVDVGANGATAFHVLHPFNEETAFVVRTGAGFSAEDFSHENGGTLRKVMRDALGKAGLFEEEAEALLETWRVSYFESPGLRLFFLLPQSWTDENCPSAFRRDANVSGRCANKPPSRTPSRRKSCASWSDALRLSRRNSARC